MDIAYFLLPFVVLIAAFFFLVVLPQRRRIASHQMLVDSLRAGDRIVTTGGIYGTVQSIAETTMAIEVAPGLDITVARGAIARRESTAAAANPVPGTDASARTNTDTDADADAGD
jgi:preprotein translocase subunit YajC